MTEYQADPNGRDTTDPYQLIEQLTPTPATAVDGMRSVYISAFRGTAGPGSGQLAQLAWASWSRCLLDGSGLRRASRRAEEAATAAIRLHVRPITRIWVTPGQVRAAARYASRTAASCR
ncbi:MAG TPA: hypothetical protein VLR26_04145 [Frankiaceae bacterium]|nr:hypothetical protein [Frankiaceae bacterium]